MYKLKNDQLEELFEYLSKDREFIIPYKKDGVSYFKKYEKKDKPFLGAGNTDYSVKPLFFPYRDILFKYSKSGDIEVPPEPKEQVLFGLRPCDLHGIAVTDAFFSDDIKDPHYLKKREKTILIAMECTVPGKNCFCDSLGMRDPVGHDIIIYPSGKNYYADAVTDSGKKIIEESNLFEGVEKADLPKREACKRKAEPVSESKIKWEKWGKKCFACGACTSVCPTCVCFDVEDELQLNGKVERQKHWASCFTKDFTTVAGGHCFRTSHTEMLKQFVSHKFPYFKEEHGTTMCVGCGRCISACMAKIDIAKIISGK